MTVLGAAIGTATAHRQITLTRTGMTTSTHPKVWIWNRLTAGKLDFCEGSFRYSFSSSSSSSSRRQALVGCQFYHGTSSSGRLINDFSKNSGGCTTVIGCRSRLFPHRDPSSSLSSVSSLSSSSRETETETEPAARWKWHSLRQVRWFPRRGARMGHHLQNLDEMAHEQSRKEAKEQRENKKKHSKKERMKQKQPSLEQRINDIEFDYPELDAMERKNLLANIEDDDNLTSNLDGSDDRVGFGGGGGGDGDGDSDGSFISRIAAGIADGILPDPERVQKGMLKVVDRLESSFASIRGGEPTPELFDPIRVNAYGDASTKLSAVAQVVIVSPTLAHVTCYDPTLARSCRDAIRDALELNPQLDDDHAHSGLVKVVLPRVSRETREKMVLQLGQQAEAARIRIRGMRQSVLGTFFKQAKEDKLPGVSKDDAYRVAKEIDRLTDQVIRKLNGVAKTKQESLLFD